MGSFIEQPSKMTLSVVGDYCGLASRDVLKALRTSKLPTYGATRPVGSVGAFGIDKCIQLSVAADLTRR
jgi:hypothetical protein